MPQRSWHTTPPEDLWRTGATRDALHAELRRVPADRKLLWFGPPMSAALDGDRPIDGDLGPRTDVADALDAQLPASGIG